MVNKVSIILSIPILESDPLAVEISTFSVFARMRVERKNLIMKI